MFLVRLIDVLFEWLTTGRFPREEFRVHPLLLVLLVIVVAPVVVAFTIQVFE